VAADDSAGSGFASVMAAGGEWVLVGAPGASQRTGAVYVFRRGPDGRWTESAKLTPADGAARDGFGSALAVGNGVAVVGAPGRAEGAGAVYAFRLDGGTWRPAGTFSTDGVQRSDAFGSSLAFRGDRVVVGAPGSGGGYGAAFVFRQGPQPDQWVSDSRLVAFNGTSQDRFGGAVATDGSALWVGAPGSPFGMIAGRTYMLNAEPGDSTYSAARMIATSRAEPRDRFGQTIAIRGDVAAVAAVGVDFGAGAVAVYERDGRGQWREQSVLITPPDQLSAVTGSERRCGAGGKVEVFACGGAELESFLPVTRIAIKPRGVRLNDMWGWNDPQTGREYALVGRIDGTSFVDVTDPVNPVFVGELPRTPNTPPGTWRDIKVYQDHAFIVADGSGAHGMQVLDLRLLRGVRNPPATFQPTAHYTLINSAHNIVINEQTGYAYAVGASAGGEICGGGLHMIDIRDPVHPSFVGCFQDPQTGRRQTGYTHDAQCVSYAGPDQRYRGREICIGSNETALSIADVTDKTSTRALSRITYPNFAYAHQGWFTEDQRYFFMDDEGDEIAGGTERTRTMIWDLTDLEQPKLAGEFLGTSSASDHNLYIKGNLMYQSNYRAGLRIIDITDPLKPVEVGYFDTAPYLDDAPGFSGTWSNYPFFKSGAVGVTSVHEGLFMVKKREGKPVS
jgi:choice-of-anchor B domain-containing protein